jgi:short-subunit dehydrogenase
VIDAARMAAIVDRTSPIALAVLNAGTHFPTRASPIDREAFAKTFDLNVMGVVNGLAAVLPGMVARGRGQCWIVSSVAGYGALPTAAAYGASKAALINLAGGLKFDLDPKGVHVGVINPGFVETPLTAKNPFPMPFLMKAQDAAKRMADGFGRPRFEITFPRRFSFMLKALNMLPYAWYFPLVAKATGWTKGAPD